MVVLLWSCPVDAHDASAWGGLFRSRDHGATWFLASPGTYPMAAIALAVSPTDANHLLLATDSGLLRSRNGGRDWIREAPNLLGGAVFAVAFAADGRRALVSTGSGLFVSDGDSRWRPTRAPSGAIPARALARDGGPGRAYMVGWTGFARTDDWGTSWSNVTVGLPNTAVTALLVKPGQPEKIHVVVGGDIWSSHDGGGTWTTMRSRGFHVDALGVDPGEPERLWGARAAGLVRSDDGGATWRAVGRPLPEPKTSVRGVSALGSALVLTTDRGIVRTVDSGEHWMAVSDNVPAHLEAGPLVRDPADQATLYAGFAVTPYPELWSRAVDGLATLRRIDVASVVGAGAFLLLLAIAAAVVLYRVRRHYRLPLTAPPRHGAGDR
jgi:photosystem II stability/assembly factor-like uncharacterized protein